MKVIILCGGLSTRLGDITKSVPKILLDIGGRTVLDWQLEKIKELGVTEVYLAAGHLSDVLRDMVGDEREGMRLHHIVEPKKLGTGGAIKHAIAVTGDTTGPYVVLNGDQLYTHSFATMFNQLDPESDGVILGTRVADAATYGTLEYTESGELVSFKEKEGKHEPGYINGGLYVFTSNIHTYFPAGDTFSIEYDVFPYVERMYVFESDSPWIDVGVPERLEWARKQYSDFI